MQVVAEPGHELESEIGNSMLEQTSHNFLCVPCHADFARGVAGVEQAEQPGPPLVIETFVGAGKQTPGPEEGIGLVPSMSEGLALHPAADLVEPLIGQAHEVKRVGDLHRVGAHGVEDCLVRAGQIEGGPGDALQPVLALPGQPDTRAVTVSAFDHIEQSAAGYIDDRGSPQCRRYQPRRKNNVSSNPNPRVVPMRSGSSSMSASP